MAKDKLTDYDSTASNNTDVGGISVAEGMLPSGVNNAIREQMSHLKDFAAGTSGVDVLKLQDDTDTNSIKLQAPASVTANTTFTLPDGDGTADQVLKTDGSGQLGFADRHPNPSLIINGAMQVWQRGTSVSSQTSSGYKTADRWYTNGSGGTYNQSQQTVTLGDSTIGDFKYFLRHEVTTGDDFTGILYRIEDVQSVPEGTVTLSFYAKGTNPNSGHFEMIARQDFGTGGSPSSDVIQTAQDVTLTTSWQRFELQITVPSISGKTLGTNGDSYYQLQFTQPSDDDSSDAWTLDITGVKLEVGSTATDFVHQSSYGDELRRCQRYFQSFETGRVNTSLVSVASSTSQAVINMPLQVEPRALASYDGALASGTFTKTGTVAVNAFPSNGDNVTSIAFWVCNSTEISVGLNTSATLVQYNGYMTRIGGSAGETVFTLDVEL